MKLGLGLFNVLQVPKLRFSIHARKYKPLLQCTESRKRYNIETFLQVRLQVNITTEL